MFGLIRSRRLEEQASRHRAHVAELQGELEQKEVELHNLRVQLAARRQFETEVLDTQFRKLNGIPKSDLDVDLKRVGMGRDG